jgi:hypothetical protein
MDVSQTISALVSPVSPAAVPSPPGKAGISTSTSTTSLLDDDDDDELLMKTGESLMKPDAVVAPVISPITPSGTAQDEEEWNW